ncbi:MAG: FAD-dependent oxidoreductase [Kiritimatiellae bacterium]|nr:FAD-dependent oxidoreductase [Kiritimatiellia bacterium]
MLTRRTFFGTALAAGAMGISGAGCMMSRPGAGGVFEPAREVPVAGDADVVVAGGGPAGIAAAVAAARQGARVILLESKGCVGGIWTNGLLGCLIGFNYSAFDREILERLDRYRARHLRRPVNDHHCFIYEPEYLKLACEELLTEAGVRVRLGTSVVAAVKDGRNLTAVITESKSGREAWTARKFVDCTGDGDLAARAGCGYDVGGAEETDPEQPASLIGLFTIPDDRGILKFVANERSNYDSLGNRVIDSKIELQDEFRRIGVNPSYGHPTIFRINRNLFILMANHEYDVPVDDADAISAATLRAHREVVAMVEALAKDACRDVAKPGAWKDVRLVATADQIYHRRARRIHGRYAMKVEDCFEGMMCPDAVATCRFGIDVHAVSTHMNKTMPAGSPFKKHVKPYQIPLRACQAADLDNLWMAGRCISGDFFTQASYRITGTAVEMGYNVGRAIACK